MPQSFPRLLNTLIRQRKIIVSIRILRHQGKRSLIRFDCLIHPLLLVQHIAQIEKRQGIFRVSFNRLPVSLLCLHEVFLVVKNRPEIDRRRRMSGLDLKDRLIHALGFFQAPGNVLQPHRPQKHLVQIGVVRR